MREPQVGKTHLERSTNTTGMLSFSAVTYAQTKAEEIKYGSY